MPEKKEPVKVDAEPATATTEAASIAAAASTPGVHDLEIEETPRGKQDLYAGACTGCRWSASSHPSKKSIRDAHKAHAKAVNDRG